MEHIPSVALFNLLYRNTEVPSADFFYSHLLSTPVIVQEHDSIYWIHKDIFKRLIPF
jgi:hypothetical protein